MKAARSLAVVAAPAAALVLWAGNARAGEFVDRPLTPAGGSWDFDLGVGIGHVPNTTAIGINAEAAVGITNRIELGVRTGLRVGDVGERGIHADQYGRMFDRETFDTEAAILANPELRIRGALLREGVAEVGLEGRVVLPFEGGSGFGLMFGVPLAFHFGDIVRLDTGAYLPIVFYAHNTTSAALFPVDIWFQVARSLALGPMTGLAFQGGGTAISLGFGLDYGITSGLDLKTMFLFPHWNQEAGDFGFGVGLQFRIE